MEFQELHLKLQKHIEEQTKNWDSLIYAHKKGFYQGFEEIKIDGCRNTEKRFERYNIEKYLSKEKSVLDIGSNCGFVVLYLSKFVRKISGVEINPYLVEVANDVKEFLERTNSEFFCSKFENFDYGEKYDIICSFANDSTIDDNTDFNFRQYMNKILKLLNSNGLVFFESQALDAFVPGGFDEKREIIKEYFHILEEKKVHSEYPINVPERFFLVLKKLDVSDF
jgi:SAM-dependent methyltransferase